MFEPTAPPNLELSEDHLVTLEAICNLLEATSPEPSSSMRQQIDTTRSVVARLRLAGTAGDAGIVMNYEIVKVEALSRVAHITMNDPQAEKWRPQQAQFGLYPASVNMLWEAITEIMAAFKKYGPGGNADLN